MIGMMDLFATLWARNLSAAAVSRIWFGTFVTDLGGAWQRHRQREADYAELQDYSDRDLRELSVCRNDIRWVVDGGNPQNDEGPRNER